MKADWKEIMHVEQQKDSYKALQSFLDNQCQTGTIYPERDTIFQAFCLTGYAETKAVILGQDPYHGPGQAHGLSFSVASPEAKFPPSLRNIFKELETDIGIKRVNTDLSDWAEQGVLLLNTVLTVEAGQAASHRGKGWEEFTDAVIQALDRKKDPVIFVLWGADAQKKKALICNPIHKILESAHPSPLSARRGFLGSRPFSRINQWLEGWGKEPILWDGFYAKDGAQAV